ncbi:MAG: polysaccharide biosynthesis/export family protein, partial [Phenylobacterium sp.]
ASIIWFGRGDRIQVGKGRRMRRFFGSLCLVLVLAGAALPASSETTAPPTPPPAPAAADIDPSYQLGTGDKLRITVFGEEALTGEFSVGDRGTVSFPLVGEVPAAKRSVAEFKSSLTAALKDGYLLDPRIAVEVLTYRPYYVLGEVGKPGEYPYTSGLTVLNAVAAASGFTYRANTKRVFIKHAGAAAEEKLPLTATQTVAPGDTIRIGERYF